MDGNRYLEKQMSQETNKIEKDNTLQVHNPQRQSSEELLIINLGILLLTADHEPQQSKIKTVGLRQIDGWVVAS